MKRAGLFFAFLSLLLAPALWREFWAPRPDHTAAATGPVAIGPEDDPTLATLAKLKPADREKVKQCAQAWIDSANRIYPRETMAVYCDSFIEVGWVESLAHR